jgi:hypothetical protein
MLRQRILEKWRSFKKHLLSSKQLLDEIGSNLDYMSLGSGIGIKEIPSQCMEMLKKRLPKIKEDCRELRNKFINGQFDNDNLLLKVDILYISYIGLVETYQKIIEDYDENNSLRSQLYALKEATNRQEVKSLKRLNHTGDTVTDLRADLENTRESEQR